MAFNLKKVLKALLLSTNQPLSIKDVQGAFTRFHDQAALFAKTAGTEESVESAPVAAAVAEAAPVADVPAPEAPAAEAGASTEPAGDAVAAVASAPADEAVEVAVETSLEKDPELYSEVPSLVTATQIREAMDQIAADLRATDEGLVLIEGNAGYRLMTHPRFGRWVRILRQEPPPVKLSQSAIETLAVVAYRQPVTRGEIETIRGVSAEAGLNKLMERELVYITGRADSPGRPIQYGTTDQFLEFVGVKSLDELPASDVLSSRQIDEWLKNSSNAHKPNDADMGLDEQAEQLPLDATAAATEAAPGTAAAEGGETPAQETPAPEAPMEREIAPPTEPETPKES
ncbi:MAG: SMC-Scp complex subunit ScpB [Verrucomicrobia bacterium]|nr:SMC-Scp complex subunit ScpB [Verrucomicrobiota bacterium]